MDGPERAEQQLTQYATRPMMHKHATAHCPFAANTGCADFTSINASIT
jgi:hypothetical protein